VPKREPVDVARLRELRKKADADNKLYGTRLTLAQITYEEAARTALPACLDLIEELQRKLAEK
jgi:hypothetical protein